MRRKHAIILVMLLIASSRIYGVENIKIDSIVIKIAPWHITTPSNISCSNFEHDISYKECHISNNRIISKVVKELSSLEISKGKSLDVRCKICFYSQGDILTSACIGSSNVLYEGVLYKTSPSLKKTIDKIMLKAKLTSPIRMSSFAKRDIPYPNGRDSLYKYLSSTLKGYVDTLEKPIKLIVNCQIDSKGNTTKVTIKDIDNTKLNIGYTELVSKLKEIFMDNIKWTPNKERFPFDIVTIPMSFSEKIGNGS